jgi:hypothetical protein
MFKYCTVLQYRYNKQLFLLNVVQISLRTHASMYVKQCTLTHRVLLWY